MKKLDYKYILTLILPFVVNYNFIAFSLFQINGYIDYIKVPYWIFNAEKYIDNISITNPALCEKIYDKVYYFDLYAYGPLIVFLFIISPLILALIKRVKILDYFFFFTIVSINCCLICHVYNQIYACWDVTGIVYLIGWIHTGIAIAGMFIFSFIVWGFMTYKAMHD